MLTISQLATYSGVTVRAVRHYHAKGLLPEPERDHSGYRRYDAGAVVELIRIRTLAAAGDRLALPPEAVDYLDRLRELEIPERAIEMERDAWILVAAQIPDQMPALMALKRG